MDDKEIFTMHDDCFNEDIKACEECQDMDQTFLHIIKLKNEAFIKKLENILKNNPAGLNYINYRLDIMRLIEDLRK